MAVLNIWIFEKFRDTALVISYTQIFTDAGFLVDHSCVTNILFQEVVKLTERSVVKSLELPTHVSLWGSLYTRHWNNFLLVTKILEGGIIQEWVRFKTTRFSWLDAPILPCGSFFSVFSDSKQETKDWNASCSFIHYLWQWHVLKSTLLQSAPQGSCPSECIHCIILVNAQHILEL